MPINPQIPLSVQGVPVPDILGRMRQRQQLQQGQMTMQDMLAQREQAEMERQKQQRLAEALAGAFDANGQIDYDKAVKAALSVNAPDVAMKIAAMKPKPAKAKEPGTHVVGRSLVDDTGKVIYHEPDTQKDMTPYQRAVLKLRTREEERRRTKAQKVWKNVALDEGQRALLNQQANRDIQSKEAELLASGGSKQAFLKYKIERLARLKRELNTPVRKLVLPDGTEAQPTDLTTISTEDLLNAFSEDEK